MVLNAMGKLQLTNDYTNVTVTAEMSSRRDAHRVIVQTRISLLQKPLLVTHQIINILTFHRLLIYARKYDLRIYYKTVGMLFASVLLRIGALCFQNK